MLGAMGMSQPAYSGSDEEKSDVMPFVELDYKEIVGMHGSGLVGAMGLYYSPLKRENWAMRILALTEMQGRDEDDAKALKGMGDRSANQYFGLEAEYRWQDFTGTVEILKGAKSDSGLLAGVTLSHSTQLSESLELEFSLAGIWGDGDYQAWEYGITPAQAARRQALLDGGNTNLTARDGKPYSPGSGMREVRAGASLRWMLNDRWSTFAMIEHGRLMGDAADSPLTRSKGQTSAGLGLVYRFAFGD
jgi:outer membrane scaffolding protein for murein synthesis (MipA/OmpV family)